MLQFVRVRQYSVAALICRGLRQYNFVRRTPRFILRTPHFLILQGSKLAGWVGCSRRYGAVYEVRHLTVLPGFRGKGVGQAAVIFILEQLEQHRAVYCYAHIRRSNIPSQELFIKCGFTLMRDGLLRKYTRPLREGLG